MGNLIKYELKGRYKLFLSIFVVAFLVNILLFTRMGKWSDTAVYSLAIMVTMMMNLLVLGFASASFEKELYEDRGYLTFTLPISGNKLVGAKLLCCLIWLAVSALISMAFSFIYNKNFLFDMLSKFNQIDLKNIKFGIVLVIISLVLLIVMIVLLVFFSTALSKTAIQSKKVGKFLGFVFFIVVACILGYIDYLVSKYISCSLNIDLATGNIFWGSLVNEWGGTTFGVSGKYMVINVASGIYNILTLVGLFLGTGYLLDNSIDM